MIVTIYDQATGAVRRVLDVPPQEVALNFDPDTEAVYVGGVVPEATYFSEGQPVAMPPRPGPWAVLDYGAGEWVDPRTPEDFAAALSQARAAASLSKIDFIMGCMSLGLLTPPEAIAAARGEIPQSFAPVVESLSPMQRDYACVHWGAARLIERMDPFIGAVAQAASVSDETLDELFGVSTPASWE